MNRTTLTGSALGSLLIVSFLLRAIFPGLAATPLAAKPPAAFATPSLPPPDPSTDGPWKASQSFFAGWGPTECPDTTKSMAREGRWCIPRNVDVKALIAIVPDPERTHMSLTFDRTLEGLQLAAQDSGYVMDRYWLPWKVQTNADGKDTADSKEAKAREVRAAEPGLVLFRKDAPAPSKPKAFFVFLVADTATTGIDGRQFRSALTYLDEVCADCGLRTDKPVRIIGPSFSGSLDSLVRLTGTFSNRPFTVYSGSVSSLCAMADQGLLPTWDPRCGTGPEPYSKPTNVTFKTFVHETESAVQLFVHTFYTPSQDCRQQRPIAILSEAATTFGSAVEGAKETKSAFGFRKRAKKTPSDFTNCIANYVYPREIASLRNAARAATGNTTASGPSASVTAPGQLPLDLTDRTNSNDAPPDFSTVQSPLSKEAVLMNLAAGLRRAHYQYIGISGTNVLDVLFLTNFLRAASPDSRLFVISADLMFERELDNAPYIGMVAVTTYPLIEGLRLRPTTTFLEPPLAPQARTISQPPFADEYEEGEYHAALATLKELLGDPLPAFTEQLATSKSKPLWMTAVGTGGYSPIRILDSGGDTPMSTSLSLEDLSGAWFVVLILTIGIAAIQTGVLLTAAPFTRPFRDFGLVSAGEHQRLFYIQVACATVALALSLLLLPAWWHTEIMTMLPLKVAGTVALIAVVGAAIMLEALYVYRWRWMRHEVRMGRKNATKPDDDTWTEALVQLFRWARLRRASATNSTTTTAPEISKPTLLLQLLTCLVVWAIAGGLLFAWANLLTRELGADRDDTWYGFFFAYRAVHLGSGVSPLTPLFPLLVAVYGWTCFEIWRLRFNDDMRPRLTPEGVSLDPSKRPLPGQLTEKPIADAINKFWLKRSYVVPLIAVFAIWLTFLHPGNPFQIVERTSFTWLYAVLFSLVVALMLSSGFRMAEIWSELRRLLVEIEHHPIRAAFSRFKGMSWSFWRQGGEDAEWAHMVRSLEAVGRLESGGKPKESGLPALTYFNDKIEALKIAVNSILERVATGAKPSEMTTDLSKLDQCIDRMQHTLSSGHANVFLVSAIDDVRASIKASLDFAKASEERIRSNEAELDPAVLRSLVEVLSDSLCAALNVIGLASVSAQAQASVDAIREVFQSQPEDPTGKLAWLRLAVLNSLEEYARLTRSSDDTRGVASSKKSRVSRFHELETSFRHLQCSLAIVLGKAWNVVEARQAKERSTLADPEERHELEAKDPSKLTPEARQLNVLEEFVALRYVSFIRGALGHLRHVMIFLALSFSLALISLNIYSFEPHQSLIWSFTLIFIVTGAMVVGVLVQLHRDPILSKVTGTTGNALDMHFYLRIVAFAAVPLLTLLATHYPAIGRYLVSFLQPSLEALK